TAPVVQNGVLYVSNATTVYALNAGTGAELWRKLLGNYETLALAAASDVVVVRAQELNSANSTLLALSAADGQQRWSVPLASAIVPTLALADGAAYVTSVSAGGSGILTAFNATDGTQRWHIQFDSSFPSPALGQGVIYALDNGSLLAINAADGTQ